jgi:hypothetical protein
MSYILLILVSDNKPQDVQQQLPIAGQDYFKKPNASFTVWKDISLRALKSISEEDASYSDLYKALPLRKNTYGTEEFFYKAEYVPVRKSILHKFKQGVKTTLYWRFCCTIVAYDHRSYATIVQQNLQYNFYSFYLTLDTNSKYRI